MLCVVCSPYLLPLLYGLRRADVHGAEAHVVAQLAPAHGCCGVEVIDDAQHDRDDSASAAVTTPAVDIEVLAVKQALHQVLGELQHLVVAHRVAVDNGKVDKVEPCRGCLARWEQAWRGQRASVSHQAGRGAMLGVGVPCTWLVKKSHGVKDVGSQLLARPPFSLWV